MATVTPDIFEHDIGTQFICEIKNLINSDSPVPLDISAATAKLIVFKKPNGAEVEFPGSFVTDGTDGLLKYATENLTDLVHVGTDDFEIWEYYAWVEYPGGKRRTSSVKFKLYKGRQSQEEEP